MLKTCINFILISSLVLSLSVLSGCMGTSTPTAPEVSAEIKKKYHHAIQSMKAGKTRLAIKQFTKVSKLAPTLAGPHTNLGILFIKIKSLQQAEGALQKAVELNSKNRVAYNYLGILYRTLGKFDDAEQAYLQAISIDNEYSYAHLNLGILYDLYKSNLEKALGHYQRYQVLTDKKDKMVDKWIVDIQRRATAQKQAEVIKG